MFACFTAIYELTANLSRMDASKATDRLIQRPIQCLSLQLSFATRPYNYTTSERSIHP